MVRQPAADKLAALERLARLRADRELRKFAAFRDHMAGLEARRDGLEASLLAGYRTETAFSVVEARRSHALTRATALDLRRCEQEALELRPRFEAARKQALREFGRAEILARLRDEGRAQARANRDSQAEALARGPGG